MGSSMASPPRPAEPSSLARAPIALATWLLAAVTLGLVVLTALPALARHLGITEAKVVVGDGPTRHPLAAPPDVGEAVSRSIDRLDDAPHGGDFDTLTAPRALSVRAEPKADARLLRTLKKGERLTVMDQAGPWVLVAVGSGSDGALELGWVATSELSRP
jgi:uncharacterized protein YgiM (DUF1202 family)